MADTLEQNQVNVSGQVNSSPAPISSIETPNNVDNMLDRAEKAAARNEAAAKRIEEAVKRHEAIAARIMLSGRAEAGQVMKTPEQTQQDEVQRQIQERMKRY